MQWEEISGDLWTVQSLRMKNGIAHEIPLTEKALQCLPATQGDATGFVFGRILDKEVQNLKNGFSGWSKAKARLDRAVGFDNWGLHDFRRTLSTRLHDAGVMPHVVEAILAHISGHKGGVAGIYNLASYRQQKREALKLWARMIGKIVGERR